MTKERLIGWSLFAVLPLSAIPIFYAMARFGISGWIRVLPPASWDGVLITASFLLYMISFTDWPEAIRRSGPIRAALQGWCFWYALLAVFIALASRGAALMAFPIFISTASATLLYFGGVLWRALSRKRYESHQPRH